MNDYYETSDLGLAAALSAVGYMLVDINMMNPRRAIFIFTPDSSLDKTVNDYWNDRLNVSALAYFDALKRMKTRLYA